MISKIEVAKPRIVSSLELIWYIPNNLNISHGSYVWEEIKQQKDVPTDMYLFYN